MPKIIDLVGQVFGKLTVLSEAPRTRQRAGHRRWDCVCLCGKRANPTTGDLQSGNTTSCGCGHILWGNHNPAFKHGAARRSLQTSTYTSWARMIQRCTDPNLDHYKNYGGANPPVLVCERWLNSFEAFLADMGERPDGTTLGRYGDIGNYELENCAWQTVKEQKAEQKIKKQLQFLMEYMPPTKHNLSETAMEGA